MTKTNEREDAPHRTAPCEPALVRKEPKLAPYENLVYNRYMRYENRYHEITEKEGSLEAFGDSYKTYGLHPDPSGAPGAVRYVEYAPSAKRLSLSRAVGIDMESATIAAQGYRFRVPYGTLLCVSDKPLHGEIKLPGQANKFYEEAISAHLKIGVTACKRLHEEGNRLHSRKLRAFNEPPFR